MTGKLKGTSKNRKDAAPLIGIDTDLQGFVGFVRDTYNVSFDDALNVTLRIGMRCLTGMMFAERAHEALGNAANPGLRRNFGAIVVEASDADKKKSPT